MSLLVLCDFDGTVLPVNVFEDQMGRYIPDAYPGILEAWNRGEVTSAALYCLTMNVLNDRGVTIEALQEDALAQFEIDPAFILFAAKCRDHDWDLHIVSDGTTWYIPQLLVKAGLDWIPVHCNSAMNIHGRGLVISHPWLKRPGDRCGVCKRNILRWGRIAGLSRVVYIGDGLADRCPVIEADLKFAKKELARFCRDQQIPYVPFESFSDVLEAIDLFHGLEFASMYGEQEEPDPGESCPYRSNERHN